MPKESEAKTSSIWNKYQCLHFVPWINKEYRTLNQNKAKNLRHKSIQEELALHSAGDILKKTLSELNKIKTIESDVRDLKIKLWKFIFFTFRLLKCNINNNFII